MVSKLNAQGAPCDGNVPPDVHQQHGSVVAYFNREHARTLERGDPAAPAAELDNSADDTAASESEVIYPDDIDDWAERLEVTPEQLRAAIRRVGARVEDVARHLGNPDVV